MQLHLVDATYELFRAHYAPRPDVLGRDGVVLSGVSGLCDQLLYLLREEGATHVGCATDRVIESFRNDLFPGYKSSAGMPPELLAQFPIAEAAIEALGIVLWPMVEFEADDAIAAAAVRFAEDERVERILVCTPDKDMAQLVRDERIVLWDRRRGLTYDDAGVRAKWGVPPTSIPDWLALVGDSSDGYPGLPGWGAKGAAAVLAQLRPLRRHPREGVGLGGAGRRWRSGDRRWRPVAARPQGRGAPLPRPRPAADRRRRGPDPPARSRTSCAGTARRADTWEAFCEEWGLDRLRTRPHRWLDEGLTEASAADRSRRTERLEMLGRRAVLQQRAPPAPSAGQSAGSGILTHFAVPSDQPNHDRDLLATERRRHAPGVIRACPVDGNDCRHVRSHTEPRRPSRARGGRCSPGPRTARSGPPAVPAMPGERLTPRDAARKYQRGPGWRVEPASNPRLPDEVEQRRVMRSRRGEDADRRRPARRGRTTGRRPSPSPGPRPARRSARRPRRPTPTGRPAG